MNKQTFTAETTLGPMQVTASFWSEKPDPYFDSEGKFSLTYAFGERYGTTPEGCPGITINRIAYHGQIEVQFYRTRDSTDYYRSGIYPYLNREMTDNARKQIIDAVLNDIRPRNLLPLIQTAKATNAQHQADREIEKAKKHLERAALWSRQMAPGDARHYAGGFRIESGYHEAQDA